MSRVLVGAGVALSVLLAAPLARADGARTRVIVAGPPDDALSIRVEQELVAMGFAVTRAGDAQGCSRPAVVARLKDTGADAATCSDGDSIGVWLAEPSGVRLRDVVVVRGADGHAHDLAAVRAAEIARASLELREPEPPAQPPPAPAAETPIPPDREADPFASDGRDKPQPPAPRPRRTASVLFGAGASALVGVDATVTTFSGTLELGVLRSASLALRAEIPVLTKTLTGTVTPVEVAPGFVGAGVIVPLATPGSIVIPRFGGGVGIAWVHVTGSDEPSQTDFAAQSTAAPTTRTDTGVSPAAYLDAALSLRLYGPLRLATDGVFGATASRIVVRSAGTEVAYWGRPFGSIGIRMEVEVP